MPRARKIEGTTPRLPRQSGWLTSETKTPMEGWVEQMARAERRRDRNMMWSEGATCRSHKASKRSMVVTAIKHQEANKGGQAARISWRLENTYNFPS